MTSPVRTVSPLLAPISIPSKAVSESFAELAHEDVVETYVSDSWEAV
jgi:hypothetical protein